jgi:hypothetical protein
MRRFAFLAAIACVCGCVLSGTGRAQSSVDLINIDFNRTGDPAGTYSGAAVLGAAGDTWNAVAGSNPDTGARSMLPLCSSAVGARRETPSWSLCPA